MHQQRRVPKAELLAEIDREWSALEHDLRRLTPEQLTGPRDKQGWSVKDHLTHLAAWQRSVVYFLEGKPRHEGVDVDRALYEAGNTDAINAAIQRRAADLSLDQAMTELRSGHARLLALLAPLDDADLYKPYRAYLPDEPGEGDGPPAFEVIDGNTAGHYREHREWINEMLNAEC